MAVRKSAITVGELKLNHKNMATSTRQMLRQKTQSIYIDKSFSNVYVQSAYKTIGKVYENIRSIVTNTLIWKEKTTLDMKKYESIVKTKDTVLAPDKS